MFEDIKVGDVVYVNHRELFDIKFGAKLATLYTDEMFFLPYTVVNVTPKHFDIDHSLDIDYPNKRTSYNHGITRFRKNDGECITFSNYHARKLGDQWLYTKFYDSDCMDEKVCTITVKDDYWVLSEWLQTAYKIDDMFSSDSYRCFTSIKEIYELCSKCC